VTGGGSWTLGAFRIRLGVITDGVRKSGTKNRGCPESRRAIKQTKLNSSMRPKGLVSGRGKKHSGP